MSMSLDYIRRSNRPPRPQVYYEPPVLDMTDLRYYKENFGDLPEAEAIESPELTEEEFIAALQDSFDERMRALTRDPVNWSKDGF